MSAGMPNAELRIVPDAVHLWNLQQPELFNETVAEFVARSSDQTRGAEGAAVGHVGPRDRIP
jgi:hypothetical protein